MEEITAMTKIRAWFLVNFTDKAKRLDTGRIGQFFGVTLMIIVTHYIVYAIIAGVKVNLEVATYLSGTGGLTMLLYRLKEFSGTSGSGFERRELEDPKKFQGFRNFFRRNFTVGFGRLDTGRIGQVSGVIALAVVSVYTVYAFVFYPIFTGEQKEISADMLKLVLGEAGLPMLLYRAKEFAQKAKTVVEGARPVGPGEVKDEEDIPEEKKGL